MISNRESARRSRVRKQRQLDELWSQVARLRTENHNLINRLNQVSDSHNLIKKENTQLREESSELRKMIPSLQAKTSRSELSDLGELSSDSTHFKVESAVHLKREPIQKITFSEMGAHSASQLPSYMHRHRFTIKDLYMQDH